MDTTDNELVEAQYYGFCVLELYDRTRTHLGLDKDAPEHRPASPASGATKGRCRRSRRSPASLRAARRVAGSPRTPPATATSSLTVDRRSVKRSPWKRRQSSLPTLKLASLPWSHRKSMQPSLSFD